MERKVILTRRVVLITTVLSIGYAILRYNILGNISWKDTPIYVLNKGISLSSLILLTVNFSLAPLKNIGLRISDNWLNARKSIGIIGFLYVFIHVLMSISILNPKYYSVFFIEDGTLSVRGVLSLLGGMLSFIFLGIYAIRFKPSLRDNKTIIAIVTSKSILIYTMLFTGVHLFFVGYTGWFTMLEWQGGLIPISLISITLIFLGFLINIVGRNKYN